MTIPVIVLAAAATMIAVGLRGAGRSWPRVRGGWSRAALLNGCQIAIVYLAGWTWDGWFKAHRAWSADELGVTTGALIGYLLITLIDYAWHRARHVWPLLWRWVHPVHHSPQRIEVITSFYKHPLEIVLNSGFLIQRPESHCVHHQAGLHHYNYADVELSEGPESEAVS